MSSPYSNSHAELSPVQADYVYWLSGLAPVATNIVTPLIVYWNMRKKPQTLLVKYNQQVNEVVRQFISGTIGLISYFGGGELTRGVINGVLGVKNTSLDDSTRQVAMITGGVLASFVGFAFVRPYISSELICRFLKHEKGEDAKFSHEEVMAILHSAKVTDKGPHSGDLISLSKAEARLGEQKIAKIAKVAGVKSEHWLIAPVQRWVDAHLVPNGVPDLAKVVRYSTVALAGYLGALTLGLWSLNRLLGSVGKTPSVVRAKPPMRTHPALMALSMAPAMTRMPMRFPVQPMMMGMRPINPPLNPMFRMPQQPMNAWGWTPGGLTPVR